MDKLKKHLQDLDQPKILDVGTGGGNFIQFLTSVCDHYESIIGIDELEIAISAAKKNFSDQRIQFQQMDALHMDFSDGSFDLVCLSNSLHHLHQLKELFSEIRRVLRPGGKVLINEMVKDNLNKKQMSHMKIHHFAAEIDRELGMIHNDTYNHQEILDVLHDVSGLTTIDYWDLNLPEKAQTKEEIDWLINTIDRLCQRVKESPKFDYFLEKGERIKEYVLEEGFEGATQLLVVLQ